MSQPAQTDARINHDRNNARFEHGKDQRKEVEAGPHHQHRPGSPFDPGSIQAHGDRVAVAVELAEGQMRVACAPD